MFSITRIAYGSVLLMLSLGDSSAQEASVWQLSESRLVQMTQGYRLAIVSPDQKHAAYVFIKGKKSRVVIDGIEQPEFDKIAGLAFSPDSKRTAYIGLNANEAFLIIDGKEERTNAANGRPMKIAFTPNSKRVYYESTSGWVIDGKLYNYKRGPVFSSDGRRFAFSGESRVTVDGEELMVNGVVVGTQIVFSPDSKHFVFFTIRSEGVFLNLDGQETPVAGGIQALAYPHQKVKSFYFWDVGEWDRPIVTFSPDSKRLAYWGYVEKGKLVMVVDGKAGAAHRGIGEAVFSADSRHVAYAAWDYSYFHGGDSFVVLDGVEQVAAKDAMGSRMTLALSANGKHLAYWAELNHGHYSAVIDGVLSKKYDVVTLPVFSPSGQHVAYTAGNYKKRQLFVDGVAVGGLFEAAYDVAGGGGVVFDADDRFHYIAFKRVSKNIAEIWRIEGRLRGNE